MAERIAVFVSYSRQDGAWLERLQVHLRPLVRRGALDLWDDTRIAPGQQWRREISRAIDRAAVAILLVSADFLASDFVVEEELPPLLRKAEGEGAVILPVFIAPCRLHEDLAAFQAVNPPQRPLSRLKAAEAEAVFVQISERVESALQDLRDRPPAVKTADFADEIGQEGLSAALFEELRSARLALEILAYLARVEGDEAPIFSEVCRALAVRSRKVGHAAMTRLAEAGWVETKRRNRRAELRITDEGLRQWRRLGSAADGMLQPTTLDQARPTPVSRPETDVDPAHPAADQPAENR